MQGLRQVRGGDLLLSREVGYRARDAQHAVVAAPGEPHAVYGAGEERLGVAAQIAELAQPAAREPSFRRPLTPVLALARGGDPSPDALRGLGGLRGLSTTQLLACQARGTSTKRSILSNSGPERRLR